MTDFVDVDIAAGRVRGRWRPATERMPASAAFLGIPFAEPPVGALRFQAPVPAAPWEGVREALEHGATAQRGDQGETLIPEPSVPGESTLTVNVVTPDPAASGLPVLVWIHGGGFVSGSPASPWYDGKAFARDGVVTVAISYRLGFDGFGWIQGAPSNRGVRDWLLALEWVQENIAAFGGDPARVTIAGQSAGGGAVLTLLGMPAAQHLFRGVYAISAALADVPQERAEVFGRSLAEAAGVAPSVAGWSTVPEERVLALQKAATKVSPSTVASRIDQGLSLGPVVDGDLIERPTRAALRAGVGADKPLVIGATDDEFTMVFGGAAAKALRWVPRAIVLRRLGLPRAVKREYLAANADVVAKGTARLAGRLLTDRLFRVGVLRVASDRAAAPTWVYRFAWPSGRFGFAEHCLDVPFFFDCLDGPSMDALAGPHPPQALADEVHAAAVAFVAQGDPGWRRHTDEGAVRVFDVPSRDDAEAYASVRLLV